MISLPTLTHYCYTSLLQRYKPEVPFGDFRYVYQYESLKLGQLDVATTKAIWDEANATRKLRKDELPTVVISLATIERPNHRTGYPSFHGVFCLSGALTAEGKLVYDSRVSRCWVPNKNLDLDQEDTENKHIVCSLKEFLKAYSEHWNFGLTGKDPTWEEWMTFALSLFQAVNHLDEDKLEHDHAILWREDNAFLRPMELINATGYIEAVYANLENRLRLKQPIPPLYQTLEQLGSVGKRAAKELTTPVAIFAAAIKNAGHATSAFSLAPSQRLAVNGWLMQEDNALCAISGPPGTGKTTTLQSIIANVVVEHALAEKDAPLIVGTSSNNQAVTNIIDAFGKISHGREDPLIGRWLPRFDSQGGLQDEAIPGIAAYFPSYQKSREARDAGLTVEDFSPNGVYACYSQSASETPYIEHAQAFLKQRGAAFLGEEKPLPVGDLRDRLHELLKETDRERQLFLSTCYHYLVTKGGDEGEARIKALEAQVARAKERGQYWQKLDDAENVRAALIQQGKAILTGSEGPLNQRNHIDLHADPDEEIPAELVTLASVATWYIAQMREAQQALRALQPNPAQVAELRRMLESLKGRFPEVFTETPEAYLARWTRPEAILEIDALMDRSLRVRAFWLALHYYECGWMEVCLAKKTVDPRDREKMAVQDTFWRQFAMLFPCAVMTIFRVPNVFSDKATTGFLYDRVDLMVVDEAGQMDSTLGLAMLPFAKRAVVVGDVNQIPPIWPFSPDEDTSFAQLANVPAEDWEAFDRYGLRASLPSSFMKAAGEMNPWTHGRRNDKAGLLLTEHYRCYPQIIEYSSQLLYEGALRPQRQAAQTDETNPFKSLPNALNYHIVNGGHSQPKGESSRENRVEAKAIVDWIVCNYASILEAYEHLQPGKYNAKTVLGVVTPFKAQARLIREMLRNTEEKLAEVVSIGTAHVFQGGECPVMLFSTVYGDNNQSAPFIEQTLELMNVAVSRAKDCFIAFCSPMRLDDKGGAMELLKALASPMQDVPGVVIDRPTRDEVERGQLRAVHCRLLLEVLEEKEQRKRRYKNQRLPDIDIVDIVAETSAAETDNVVNEYDAEDLDWVDATVEERPESTVVVTKPTTPEATDETYTNSTSLTVVGEDFVDDGYKAPPLSSEDMDALLASFDESAFPSGNVITVDGTQTTAARATGGTPAPAVAVAKPLSTPVGSAEQGTRQSEVMSLSQWIRRWQSELPDDPFVKELNVGDLNKMLLKLGWLELEGPSKDKVPSALMQSRGAVLSTFTDPQTQETRRYARYTAEAAEKILDEARRSLKKTKARWSWRR